MNADAMAGRVGELLGANVYTYCQNNPVKLVDKDGFHPAEWDGSDSVVDSSTSSNIIDGITSSKIIGGATATGDKYVSNVVDEVIPSSKMSINQLTKGLSRTTRRQFTRGIESEMRDVELNVPGASSVRGIKTVGILSAALFGLTAIHDFNTNKGKSAWEALGIDALGLGAAIVIGLILPGGIIGIGAAIITSELISYGVDIAKKKEGLN